jgi:hypothetical protein
MLAPSFIFRRHDIAEILLKVALNTNHLSSISVGTFSQQRYVHFLDVVVNMYS